MNFIKVASACPIVNIGDVEFNIKNIKKCINLSLEQNCKLIVFPELSITSYTCGDLFLNQTLIEKSLYSIKDICDFSYGKDILISVGAPFLHNYCLYNCAYIIFNGKLLGIVPKSYLPNYSEFYEKRWFTEGHDIVNEYINLPFQSNIPFGTNLIFTSGEFKFGFEVCEDLWTVIPPSSYLSLMGANIIGNLSASNELVAKANYRKSIVSSQSGRCVSAYVYSSAGVFESTTDVVFSGHLIIAEDGTILKENSRFQRENEIVTSIIDVDKLNNIRIKNLTFRDSSKLCPVKPLEIFFEFSNTEIENFDRFINKHPFVPCNEIERAERSEEIFNIQCSGLAKRLNHTGIKNVVLGISGGLDSTLALLTVIKTFDMLDLPRKNITTITMPGFGTTDRTYTNAVQLCKEFGTNFKEINIVNACLQHFKDINHPIEIHDVTYENVQARERTQILMDLANKEGALLIGTGDLSEIALGWSTYNGDHMSMYSVNCSIPKTLVKYLVKHVSLNEYTEKVQQILTDILNTPVSPELLPKDSEGNISQKTEDLVGPYELHDFFLYYFIRQNATPEKILFLAKHAFKENYDEKTIKKWLDKFIKRFFTQQFKRSAIPDGPKVGTISLSPRGDLKMPSDASYSSWILK